MAKKKTSSKRKKDSGSWLSTIFGGILMFSLIIAVLKAIVKYVVIHWIVFAILLFVVVIIFVFKIVLGGRNRKSQAFTTKDIISELNRIDSLDGRSFEFWCAGLLRECGFSNVTVTPGSNDQGVDIIGVYGGEKYAIQCKRYSSKLSNTPIQEVYTGAAYYHCNKAAVMTNTFFTPGAINAASRIGVQLWDRNEIKRMLGKISSQRKESMKKTEIEEKAYDINKWPHNLGSKEIDTEYYAKLPPVYPVANMLTVPCAALGGSTEKYNPYDDWDDNSYMIEVISPFFSTEKDAEHFRMAITKKYFAIAKRNGNMVSAFIHDVYIHNLFDQHNCVFILDNFCE